jgi:hypothetical protein
MDLPLADEIREARRRAEEATDAAMQLMRVGIALQALGMIETHLARTPNPGIDLPGDDLVDQMADRWPALGDLRSAMPNPGAPYLTRLQARRMQLESARQVLRPLAEGQGELASRLARLQHEQQHALAAPQYAVDVAELAAMAKERERLARDLQPVNRLLQILEPAVGILSGFETRLAEALADARQSDPSGFRAWRASHLANGLLEGLSASLGQLEVGVSIPSMTPPPEAPSAELAEELATRVEDALDAIRALRDDIGRQCERVRRDSAEMTATFDRLTRRIVERMG